MSSFSAIGSVASDQKAVVREIVVAQPVVDVHTHLYPPAFGSPLAGRGGKADPDGLLLWGIDELLTYHYLVCEVFRAVPPSEMPYAKFWAMTKSEQADHIWQNLFLERSPISEACRGVVTTLERLGLDPAERSLAAYRRWFAEQPVSQHIDRVMELAGVRRITMTNDVFDDNERARWLADPSIGDDPRFTAVLRFDLLAARLAGGVAEAARLGLRHVAGAQRGEHRGGPQVFARLDRTDQGRVRGGEPAARFSLRRAGRRLPHGRRTAADRDARARRSGAAVCDDDRRACAE